MVESIAQVLAVLLLFGGGMLFGWAFLGLVGRARRSAGPATRSLIGRPEPAPWAQDHWACARCRSVNPRWADRCQRCRAERASAQIPVPPAAGEPDIIPVEIQAAGALVLLEHNATAHDQELADHWRLRVNGVIRGSAARRDGALGLLRSLRGTETVFYDPRGDGVGPYPITALIRAFEAPALPLAEPCPDHAATLPWGH